jgi:hypothetical protein
MRRSVTAAFARVLCTALLAGMLPAGAWAADDVCVGVDPNQTLDNYLLKVSSDLNQDLQALNKEALADASAARPSSDGLSPGGRLDLLRRAFVGLGLGQVTDEEGQLVFNFNPAELHRQAFGQFSPRIVIHQAGLDGALDEHIDTLDEELRTPARDELKKTLGDLDDVEYSVRWTPSPLEPAVDLQNVAGALLDKVVPDRPSAITNKVSQGETAIALSLGKSDLLFVNSIRMEEICGETALDTEAKTLARASAKLELERLVQTLHDEIPSANQALDEALEENGFNRLIDLIEGNPRLVVSGTHRQRSGVAGPDTTSVEVTFQKGWVSYRGAKSLAERQKKNFDADFITEYFKNHPHVEGAAPLFSLVASYTKTDAFLVPITGAEEPFSLDAGHKLSVKGTAGGYFGGGRDRKLELTATFDDVSNDEKLHDRFVANLTWVETLNGALAQAVGGSEFVATLVWANKPEFRGEVDEDFGLRAGLKWSLGDGK